MEVEPLSLRANFGWTLVGNVVYAVSQWGMLVALAKTCPATVVGAYAFALALSAPLMLWSGLNLRAVQVTDRSGRFPFETYLAVRSAGVTVALAVLLGISFATSRGGQVVALILVTGSSKALESLSDVYYGLFQQRERMDIVAKSMMMRGPLGLCLMAAALVWARTPVLGVAALVVSNAAVLGLFDLPNGRLLLGGARSSAVLTALLELPRRVHAGLDRRSLIELARTALPLGVVMGLGSVESNVPRYVLERLCGLGAVGIYSTLAYAMVVGNTVVNAVGQAASPRLAHYYEQGDRAALTRLVAQLIAIAVVAGLAGAVVVAVAGRSLLTLLYAREYANYAGTFLLLMFAALLTYVLGSLGVVVTAMRRFRIQAPMHVALVLVILIVSALCIRAYGIPGAAVAMVISMGIGVAGYGWIAVSALQAVPMGRDRSFRS